MKKSFLLLSLICFVQMSAQIITTIAGNGTSGFGGDGGPATSAQLALPMGVTFDALGNMYIAEASISNRIRKVDLLGNISTAAGNGTGGYSGDGGPATSAALNVPFGITVDAAGNLFIPDFVNNRIRKVNTSGIISTVVGIGTGGFNGDGGLATLASIAGPTGVAFDASGNMYISEYNNNRIRKVNTSGIISTVAGTGVGGYSGDGAQATLAQVLSPSSIAIDAQGNLYFGDCNNNRIRKVSTSGVISTVAGNGNIGFSGDGGAATLASLWGPDGITFDAAGNLIVADDSNHRIRKVNATGVITTVAGNGSMAYSGDGGPATAAGIGNPNGIAFDAAGILYIADTDNNRIRKVTPATNGLEKFSTTHDEITIWPNPATEYFMVNAYPSEEVEVILSDLNGKCVLKQSAFVNRTINVTHLPAGVYTLMIKSPQTSCNKKLVIIH